VAILRWEDFTGEKATLNGLTFAEVKDARYNENADLAGSVQDGPNAVEDIGAGVTAAARDAHSSARHLIDDD
jgi:hypothetical protein